MVHDRNDLRCCASQEMHVYLISILPCQAGTYQCIQQGCVPSKVWYADNYTLMIINVWISKRVDMLQKQPNWCLLVPQARGGGGAHCGLEDGATLCSIASNVGQPEDSIGPNTWNLARNVPQDSW